MARTSKDGLVMIGESWADLGITVSEDRKAQKVLCPSCPPRKNTGDRSLSIDADNGVGNCHHCGMRFVIDRYKGNLTKLESTKDYKLPEQDINYDINQRVADWFEGRKISLKTLKGAMVTSGEAWMPQIKKKASTINFNYFFNDTLVNVKYRDGRKNFKFESGAKLMFYNLDCLLDRDLTSVVIVEGEIDALTYIEAGISNVISVPNGASKGSMNLDYLTSSYELFDNVWRAENGYQLIDKIVVATDDDEPGNALKSELVRRLGSYRCYEVDFKGYNDPNELLMAEGKVSVFNTFDMATMIPMADITEANELLAEILKMRADGGLKPGAQVGSDDFKRLLSFDNARLTLVTGIPTHGKTVFVDDLICRLAVEYDWVFALFSPESFPIQLHVTRLLSKLIGKHFNIMTPQEIKSGMDFVNDHFVWIYPENENYTLKNILNITRDTVKRYGVNSLIIDPWTEIDKGGETDTEGVNDHLSVLNQFKRDLGLHVFMVAHPTKMQKDPLTKKSFVPDLYDISGSANFFNKADGGITVYRHFDANMVDIFVNKAKFEHLGRVGNCTMQYNVENGRYQGLQDVTANGWDSSNWLQVRAEQMALGV